MTADWRILPCLAVASGLALGGCTTPGVEVWEREILARPEMQFHAYDPDLVMDDHFYFSKEGTSGGRGFAGGGCGCN